MGQCGQGNFNSPIRKPVKVINLEGVPVHQISAGTSHSIVWTAVPSNRLVFLIFEKVCLLHPVLMEKFYLQTRC